MSMPMHTMRQLDELMRHNERPFFETRTLDELRIAIGVFEDLLEELRQRRDARWERDVAARELSPQRWLPFEWESS